MNTHGCMRIKDSELVLIKKITDALEIKNPDEAKNRELTVTNSLTEVDAKRVQDIAKSTTRAKESFGLGREKILDEEPSPSIKEVSKKVQENDDSWGTWLKNYHKDK